MPFLKSSMTLRFKTNIRLLSASVLILLLLLGLELGIRAAQSAPQSTPPCVTEAARTTRPTVEKTVSETTAAPSEETADILTMKQRYGHDPTGVRARLGMCRRGQGRHGHGGGRHRQFRGGNRWQGEGRWSEGDRGPEENPQDLP